MAPAIVLLSVFFVLRSVGVLGVAVLNNSETPLRFALAVMFLLTASAHWGRGRADLIGMVPPQFPSPGAIVTITGILEILGALGLMLPHTARAAAICLAILLAAMFPANLRAARERLPVLGRTAMGAAKRGALQLLFIAALLAVAIE